MISMVTKKMFLDRKAVVRGVDRATRRVLGRFGAFVRRAARSSIRKRKRISLPGKPPSSHLGLLKKLIYFGYDRDRRSVVIGPEPLHSSSYRDGAEMLEYGGTTTRTVFDIAKGGRSFTRRRVRAKYRARPFMGPALEQEKPKLPAMWAGSVK